MGLETLGILGMVAAAGGTAVSAKSALDNARYQRAVLRNQREMAAWNARDAERRGLQAEQEHGRKLAEIRGAQLVGAAASGVDIGVGSPVAVLAGTESLADQDAANIRANWQREAWGFQTQGSMLEAQSAMARYTGTMSTVGILLDGTTTGFGIYRTAKGY